MARSARIRRLTNAFRSLPRLFRKAGRLRLQAEQAERRKDWKAAQQFWLAYADMAPKDPAGLAGAVRSLLIQNRLAEARQTAERLQARFPDDPVAASALAQIAAARQDWQDAARHWEAVLARDPHGYNASMGRAQALVALGRAQDAELQAQALAARHGDKPGVAILLAQTADDAELALQRWQQAADRFPGDANVLRDFGLALAAAGRVAQARAIADRLMTIDRRYGLRVMGQVRLAEQPRADLTEFWRDARREFPAVPEFFRREIDASLRAGRTQEAAESFSELVERHTPRISDAAFLIGLWKQSYAGVDTLARRYLKKLRGTAQFRPALLRLSRLIFSSSPNSSRTFAQRTQAMVARAHIPAGPRDVLSRVLAIQQSLGGDGMDGDVSPDICRRFIARVHDLVASGSGAAFVRVGDADANCLPYEAALAPFARADAMERETVWWGAPVADEARAAMAARVLAAAQACDIVGIPTVEWFLRDIDLERNDDLTRGRSGRGLRATLHAMETGLLRQGNAAKIFASAHLHQHLQRFDLYGELFDLGCEVVLVSPHPDLADALRARFNLPVAAQILTPARHASMDQMAKRLDTGKTLPQVIDTVLADVAAVARGRIVIVGAGYLGKLIVAQARAQGGFGFDAGSAVDTWMGIRTRSYLD